MKRRSLFKGILAIAASMAIPVTLDSCKTTQSPVLKSDPEEPPYPTKASTVPVEGTSLFSEGDIITQKIGDPQLYVHEVDMHRRVYKVMGVNYDSPITEVPFNAGYIRICSVIGEYDR